MQVEIEFVVSLTWKCLTDSDGSISSLLILLISSAWSLFFNQPLNKAWKFPDLKFILLIWNYLKPAKFLDFNILFYYNCYYYFILLQFIILFCAILFYFILFYYYIILYYFIYIVIFYIIISYYYFILFHFITIAYYY